MDKYTIFLVACGMSGIFCVNVKLNFRGAGLPLQCITQSGITGLCLNVHDCINQGGKMIASCHRGINFGVCCIKKTIELTSSVPLSLSPMSSQSEDYEKDTDYDDDDDSYGEYKPIHDSAVTYSDYEEKVVTMSSLITTNPNELNAEKTQLTADILNNLKFPLNPEIFSSNRARTTTSSASTALMQFSQVIPSTPASILWNNQKLLGFSPDLSKLFSFQNKLNNIATKPTPSVNNKGSNSFDPSQRKFDLEAICGKPVVRMPKIYGGTTVILGEFPWQASLREIDGFTSTHKCGTVLLHPKWVITAAHCASQIAMDKMVVRIGDVEVDNDNATHSYRDASVKRIVIHPDFSFWFLTNDLAILELSRALPMRSNIIPICLPPQRDFKGKLVTLTGWGRISTDGPLLKVLHKVQAPVLSNKQCENMFRMAKQERYIEEQLICTGYPEGGKDACEGDSGGPVQLEIDGRWAMIGVISWGVDCGHPNQPGASTLITKYSNWITATTNNDVYVPSFFLTKQTKPISKLRHA